jgi:hypothetical protein
MYSVRTRSTESAVRAESAGPAVEALSERDTGVLGFHGDPRLNETTVATDSGKAGVFGASEDGAGVLGYARADDMPAIYAFGGLLAISLGKDFAGEFHGDVKVTGDVLLAGADCAERFDVVDIDEVQPGSVLVIGDGGGLCLSDREYDSRVAGVVSGAGAFRPGVVLDSGHESDSRRVAVALVGKVSCLVDASHGPIGVGDLLTTSPTPGHAMRATDPQRAFGSVLGKALQPLRSGRALLPTLVVLG